MVNVFVIKDGLVNIVKYINVLKLVIITVLVSKVNVIVIKAGLVVFVIVEKWIMEL